MSLAKKGGPHDLIAVWVQAHASLDAVANGKPAQLIWGMVALRPPANAKLLMFDARAHRQRLVAFQHLDICNAVDVVQRDEALQLRRFLAVHVVALRLRHQEIP